MRPSKEKIKYLLHLYHHQNDHQSLTWLARQLGISKSTLSRVINGFFEDGLIAEKGKVHLSAAGMKQAKAYQKDVDRICDWLMTHAAFTYEEAYDEAIFLYVSLSSQAKDKLITAECMNRFFQTMRNIKFIYGDMLTVSLCEGEYPLAFAILQKDGTDLSIVNDGFVHPGSLRIERDQGMFVFQTKEMEWETTQSHMTVKGFLSSFHYQSTHGFKEARQIDKDFFVPVSHFRFYHCQEERILQTVFKIRIRASAGSIHMFECEALLNVIIK